MQKADAQIAHLWRENEFLRTYMDYLQDMFDAEKKINAGLEEILEEHWQHTKKDYISSMLSYVSHLFHPEKKIILAFLPGNCQAFHQHCPYRSFISPETSFYVSSFFPFR